MHISPAIFSLILAVIVAFVATYVTAPPVIALLRRKKLGQQIRDDGPQRHLSKAGTPTMGGLVILAGVLLGTLACWLAWPQDIALSALVLGLTISVAGVGSIDDWGKIRRGRSLGLRARDKLLLQFLLSALFIAGLLYWQGHGASIGIPGIGEVPLGWLYWPLAMLLITGMSNAVNLTDGLDGLAAGTTVAAALALALVAWLAGSSLSVAGVLAALAAACLAFLRYNRYPARVFMGDTGSLAIGAALAGSALALKQEVLLLLIGLIFLIEMFSVIIQVIFFQTTGKRVFRMSPFHHHLELGGWSEPKIVARAWLLGAVLALLACGLVALLR